MAIAKYITDKTLLDKIAEAMKNPRISAYTEGVAKSLEKGNGRLYSKTDPSNPDVAEIKNVMSSRAPRGMSNPYTYTKRSRFEDKAFGKGKRPFYGFVEGTLSDRMKGRNYHNYGDMKINFKQLNPEDITYTIDDSMKEYGNVFKNLDEAIPNGGRFPFYTDFVEAQIHRPLTPDDIESVQFTDDFWYGPEDIQRLLENKKAYDEAINVYHQHPYPTRDIEEMIAADKYGYPLLGPDGKCFYNCK